MEQQFLGGVVEGFYGQPWTMPQRIELFRRLQQWGLNTYFYAPKDDLKHRALWRVAYDDSELADLAHLVSACRARGLRFIYGLSPGLDIHFSSEQELACIKARLAQLMSLGVHDFALLFDDLPGEMRDQDRRAFASVAEAQSHVTRQTFDWLRARVAQSRLLFCPTPYCERMDRAKLGGSDYLETIGMLLPREVDVLWTGPEIISAEITAASLSALIERIRRKPVLWDNLHANDYDGRRVFCGPYSGRSPELTDLTAGIVSNPNNEFWINYVPLRTLAAFLNAPERYHARDAYLAAVREWTDEFVTIGGGVPEEDVRLLADCFYLPHEHGERANELLALVGVLTQQPVERWGDRYETFLSLHARVVRTFQALTQLRHRELFYAWSRRVWELREELDLMRDFLEAKRNGALTEGGFTSETHLPHTYRGGLVADLQRWLEPNRGGRIQPRTP